VRRLSYSALSLFERCSYRYFAERVVGLRPADASGSVPGQKGLAATEIGDAVHALLERIDLTAPSVPEDLVDIVRARYPAATDEEVERIRGFVASYCGSELAARIAALEGAAPELPFAFEHDGVLLHGRIDVLHREGMSALVLDYKTNSLADAGAEPEEIVEHDYRLQRLVYALACFRAGAEQVEVVYHFLERPDAVVTDCYKVEAIPALEAELSEAIARIQANDFRPTPDEFVCADCPALNLVCAGPRLRHIA
jgi:RecB family exonuclease